ncbi:deoxyribonuclease II family protein [Algoriphagus namhaensis]|uniref:Deoxyribonuclease II family protein n=1 Tax=Algoriphagus namhaensis TaxID=915353 RepID=A0ABV8AY76_9BACT
MISPLSNVDGKPVDWWFMYKLPMNVGPKKDSTGFEFLYFDAQSTDGVKLSSTRLNEKTSALGLTLAQIFSSPKKGGFVLWNDEIPPTTKNPNPKNQGQKGHSKGILAFSKETNSGFYLLHSTPRFPTSAEIELPENERKFGQTYLCISLKDYETANAIAEVVHTQNDGQVYESNLEEVSVDDAIYKFAKNLPYEKPSKPANLTFASKEGKTFSLIAKNRVWSKPKAKGEIGFDFWKDLIGPTLAINLSVETWRRGMVFDDIDSVKSELTEDIVDIDLSKIGLDGYRWGFSKDHAKWGISFDEQKNMIIIADINRQISQERRGGGGIAFENPILWKTLKKIEIIEKVIEKTEHIDRM